jgi:hypothetical protein
MPHNPNAPAVSASVAQGDSHGEATFFRRGDQIICKMTTSDRANSPEARASDELKARYPVAWAKFVESGA